MELTPSDLAKIPVINKLNIHMASNVERMNQTQKINGSFVLNQP